MDSPSPVHDLKTRLRELVRLDHGVYRDGAAQRRERVALVRGALEQLWRSACESASFTVPDTGVGLAATGSLSRGWMGPCSDLDLVLIHDGRTLGDDALAELANLLWYPLWDSGLDLDHAVRSRAQCASVTDHDLPAATGWLQVTPIAGDAGLIEDTATTILTRWRKAARRRLPELLDSARSRLDEFGLMCYLNQPDVKEARGGLRDAVLVFSLAASWLADHPHGDYDEAVERLLDVRDCIHLTAGRDTNLLLAAYQPQVAAMLGLSDPTLPEEERQAAAAEALMTRLARLGRTIAFSYDVTASRAEHSLIHERPRFAFFQLASPRSGGRRAAPVFDVLAPGVAKHEGEIVLAPNTDPTKDGTLPLRVGVTAAEQGLPIAASTLTHLRSCPISDTAWDGESRDLFVRLLACGKELPQVWEELDAVGIPGRWMPEWLGVRNRPSASAAHRYTIDQHMVQAVSLLGRLRPSVPQADGIASTTAGMPYDAEHYTALLLAGLLHDIGKRPGITDHAAEGARHVPAILRRMGYGERVVNLATLLVREHLTLSEFATGRDPNDPGVADELVERVEHDPQLLDMLYDLTRADGSSLGATAGETITGRQGWSSWRQATVGAMYAAARERM